MLRFPLRCQLLLCLMVLTSQLSLYAIQVSQIRTFEYTLKSSSKFGGLKLKPKITAYHDVKDCSEANINNSGNNLKIDSFFSSNNRFGYEITISGTENHLIYGLGEQYSHLTLNGTKPVVITEEQGIGRGDKPLSKFTQLIGISGNEFTSYCPIPILYIGNQYALVIENLSYAEFDLTPENELRIHIFDNCFQLVQMHQKNLPELIRKVTERYGRMHHLPEWAFGTCMGLQGGTAKVENILAQAKRFNNPVKSVWIQDWVGRRKTRLGSQLYWQWISDTLSYPDLKNRIRKWNEEGIKVLGYVNPFLATEGPLTREALDLNYLVKNKKGEAYRVETGGFPAYMLDLTHPGAVAWIKNIIRKNMIDPGFSGWMADFGEWLPFDATLYNGQSGYDYHNQYTVDWARINREVIRESGMEDSILFFNRSGSLHTAQWSSMMWCGDQMTYDEKHDGMPSAINALITSGISGIQLNHADIGGYAGTNNIFIQIKRSESLLKRWIEWSAFTPFYRTHEGLIPDEFAQVYQNDSMASHFARYGRIHYRLKPYLEQLLAEAKESGYPLIRPLFFHYPEEKESYRQDYTFLLGDELLIVPDIRISESSSFYLPSGNWIHLQSGAETKGGQLLNKNGFQVFAVKGGKNEALFRSLFVNE